ncbi:hypothetical protein GCM10010988_05680 [Cnuibacter physcomitrellae]|nr:hypothetical protein GCM10010988_05680 [Cnuibacter physcomitrellae]
MRSLRVERGLSQEALARMLTAVGRPFHQTTVAKLEKGARPTSVEELYLLALIFETDVPSLFTTDPEVEVQSRLARLAGEAARLAGELADRQRHTESLQSEYEQVVARYNQLLQELSPSTREGLQRDG